MTYQEWRISGKQHGKSGSFVYIGVVLANNNERDFATSTPVNNKHVAALSQETACRRGV